MTLLLAVDAATLYFRAFHAISTSVRSPDGRPVNAVRGYLDMTATLVERFRPGAYAACWDADWRPAFRVAAIPSYKAHRVADAETDGEGGGAPGGGSGAEAVPDELGPQVDVLAEGLALLGLARVEAAGFEADDVAATLARRWSADGGDTLVVSGDKDLVQLVDDGSRVSLAYIGRGIAKLEVIDDAAVSRRFGVPGGASYRDLALLVGDRSDGLPGVRGVGPGTAADLLRRFGDLDGLMAAADDPASDLSAAWRRRLGEARDYVAAARTVVTAVADAPVRVVGAPGTSEPDGGEATVASLAVERTPPDLDALDAWAERWGLRTSVGRVLAALGAGPGPEPPAPPT